jgi:centromere-localized protein 2
MTKPHTLKSIIPELENASQALENEVRRLEEEAETLLEEMRATVGGLSDLRYGRLGNGHLRDQVLEGLQRLESACDKA